MTPHWFAIVIRSVLAGTLLASAYLLQSVGWLEDGCRTARRAPCRGCNGCDDRPVELPVVRRFPASELHSARQGNTTEPQYTLQILLEQMRDQAMESYLRAVQAELQATICSAAG